MKRKFLNIFLIFSCFGLSTLNVSSQQINTMYFMDDIPVRNYLNPAFQPYCNFYLGLPIIGYSQFSSSNNSITLKDFAYRVNNIPIIFLNANGNIDNFYNVLKPTTLLNADIQLNLLNFGFRTGKAYWNFSLTEKIDGQIGIPKDFMKLLLYGTPNVDINKFNLNTFGVDFTAYTEAGLGYSRTIGDKWSVGAKLKLLIGSANISTSNQNLELQAGIDQWTLKGQGTVNAAIPGNLTTDPFDYSKPTATSDFIKPSGMGGGIDLGLTFKPIENLTLSGAITDLGLIRWTSNTHNINYKTDYTFNGIKSINVNSQFDAKVLGDSLLTALKNSVTTSNGTAGYTTYTSPKVNIGVEYGFFENKLTLGALSRTVFRNNAIYEEATASINAKPTNWFNLSLSYSVLNGRTSNIGAGLALRTGLLNWFLSADYIPLNYADISTGNNPASITTVPYNTKGINLGFGLSFVFGNHKDADKDGVADNRDKCPDTPIGVKVNKKGCPIDTDGDGVPDNLDKCPKTPKEAKGKVDGNGCPIDTDGDGVPDYLDKCPDTPKQAANYVDRDGCLRDSDGDGVPDYLDKCKDTPAGIKVDKNGCPLDSDGDGVPDYLDKCPDTPKEAKGMVDKNGCLLDSDGDGVPNYLDLCPNTPAEAKAFVDKNGCRKDTDGDGVPDYLDKCPDTPIAAHGMVDLNGCPRDTDGDGVPDYLDKCPTIPGVAANKGCPEIKKEVRTLFQKALQGIQFESGRFTIKPISYSILNKIANVLIVNPTYMIEVQGHTDNAGKPETNLLLSEKRAEAVKVYLISKDVNAKLITSHGYGDTVPMASNKTSKGRALNRRVEFIVWFEKVELQ